MDSILDTLNKQLTPNDYLDKETWINESDPSGKSIVTDAIFIFESGSIVVACYDYSEEYGDQDHLSVSIDKNEFYNRLLNDSFKDN